MYDLYVIFSLQDASLHATAIHVWTAALVWTNSMLRLCVIARPLPSVDVIVAKVRYFIDMNLSKMFQTIFFSFCR